MGGYTPNSATWARQPLETALREGLDERFASVLGRLRRRHDARPIGERASSSTATRPTWEGTPGGGTWARQDSTG
jgi:hypothetical protein